MRFRQLRDVAPPSASRTKPAPNEIVWHLTLDQIESGSGRVEHRIYGPALNAASSSFVFDNGNVLYSKLRPYLNKVICPDTNGVATTELVPLRPNPQELTREYLCFFLRSPEFVSWASGQVDGAKMPRMKMNSFWAYEIPTPPIDDQIRIAYLLGKVEGLIAKRKQHLQQFDDLLKSVFLEMFGDPVQNEKGWNIHPCEKAILDISSGASYGGEDRAFASPDEIGVLKISAVTKGTFDPTEFKVVNPTQIKKALRFVKRGDFLFSRANTVELVAACCIVPQDYNQLFLPDKLWVMTLNPELINPQFFNFLLKNERYRNVVRNLANGGHDSMLNISMKKFMTLDVPCPPIDIQNNFSIVIEKVEGIKSRYQKGLDDLEVLYGALSQQAFKGELDLSRVLLPRIEPAEEKASATQSFHAPAEQSLLINLPDTDELSAAFADGEVRERLITRWLEAYLSQLGNTPFSAQHFMAAAQTRLAELQPDNDFALTAHDYEHIKNWVFDKIGERKLKQTRDIICVDGKRQFGNKLLLRARRLAQ